VSSEENEVIAELYWEYVTRSRPLEKTVLAGHMLRHARSALGEAEFEELERRWERCVRISVLADSYLRYLKKLYKDSPFASDLLPYLDGPNGEKQAVAPASIEAAEAVFDSSAYKGVVLSLAKLLPQLYREIDDIVHRILTKTMDKREAKETRSKP